MRSFSLFCGFYSTLRMYYYFEKTLFHGYLPHKIYFFQKMFHLFIFPSILPYFLQYELSTFASQMGPIFFFILRPFQNKIVSHNTFSKNPMRHEFVLFFVFFVLFFFKLEKFILCSGELV